MLSYLMPNATKLRRRGLIAPWEYTCFELIKDDPKIDLKRAQLQDVFPEFNATAGGKPQHAN